MVGVFVWGERHLITWHRKGQEIGKPPGATAVMVSMEVAEGDV